MATKQVQMLIQQIFCFLYNVTAIQFVPFIEFTMACRVYSFFLSQLTFKSFNVSQMLCPRSGQLDVITIEWYLALQFETYSNSIIFFVRLWSIENEEYPPKRKPMLKAMLLSIFSNTFRYLFNKWLRPNLSLSFSYINKWKTFPATKFLSLCKAKVFAKTCI